MASLMQWLSEDFPGRPPFEFGRLPVGVPEKATKLQVLAALIGMGGWNSSGYGVTQGGGTYGRQGLQQGEAFLFWDMRAFVEGVLYATHDAERTAFMSAVEAEWARVESLTAEPAKPFVAEP